MQDLEIVVVDDGSRNPPTTITELDPRVRLVIQANHGVSVARNVGVAAANGELIAFLDQDDEWLPLKLESQLSHVAAKPDAAFWCTGFYWVAPDSTTPSYPVQLTYRGLLRTQSVILSTVLVRRSDYWAAGGHDPLLSQMQDWDLFLRLSADAAPPAMLADHLVRYHLHEANASRNYREAARERLEILGAHERRARSRGDDTTLNEIRAGRVRTRELFAHKAVEAARGSLRDSKRTEALEHLSFAARLRPHTVARAIAVSAATQARRTLSRLGRTPEPRLSFVVALVYDVVIPTHGRNVELLMTSVESVRTQTLPPRTIVIVVDATEEVAQRIRTVWPALIIIRIGPDAGPADARTAGVNASTSPWVCFVDDDDLWHHDKMLVTARYLSENPGCMAVRSTFWVFSTHSDHLRALNELRVDMFGSTLVELEEAARVRQPITPFDYLRIEGDSLGLLLEKPRCHRFDVCQAKHTRINPDRSFRDASWRRPRLVLPCCHAGGMAPDRYSASVLSTAPGPGHASSGPCDRPPNHPIANHRMATVP